MSAMFTLCWQIKSIKSRKCLPCTVFAGGQNQEKAKYVCQVQFVSADKIAEMLKTSAGFTICLQIEARKS